MLRGTISISGDRGLTWSEAYRAKDEKGEPLTAGRASLVRLSDGEFGLGHDCPAGPNSRNRRDNKMVFRRSEDEGRTWSPPVVVAPGFAYHDVLLRTSSGRLIFPTYVKLGQGSWHMEGAPFAGGYVNGNFVSTDAHFVDPGFTATNVAYSDDHGRTWQLNRDGELFVVLGHADGWYGAAEGSVCEVSPGKLLMVIRTRLGRLFQARSYDNGETWTRPQPTQLAGTQAPAQVRTVKDTGHLLVVFAQHSEREIRQGFIRTRLSSAISRNGGGVWEHFQNVESIHEETHVEAGPIRVVKPEGRYAMVETGAAECDPKYVVPLPVGYGRWSYPSVLVLKDRVLIEHSYSHYDQTGTVQPGYRTKVLPISWFYGGHDPNAANPTLEKIRTVVPQP